MTEWHYYCPGFLGQALHLPRPLCQHPPLHHHHWLWVKPTHRPLMQASLYYRAVKIKNKI